MTRSDLAALARELNISGRSTMSRTELEQAVTKARGSRRRAS